MNKVYKVVWSKVKNCHVVVSELAKNRTKAPRSSVISRTLVASVLTAIFSFGAVMPVLAADKDTVTSAAANTTKLYLLGHTGAGTAQAKYDSGIYATTTSGQLHVGSLQSAGAISGTSGTFSSLTLNSNNIVLGNGASQNSGTQGVIIGGSASIDGNNAVAIGDKAIVTGVGGIRIGAVNDGNLGITGIATTYAVNIGFESNALGTGSVVLGPMSSSDVEATDSIVIGRNAKVDATTAIAIGKDASNSGIYSIAVGSSSLIDKDVDSAIAFGNSSHVSGTSGGIAIGTSSNAGTHSVALGTEVSSSAYGVALGYNSSATGTDSIAIGTSAIGSGGTSVALGESTFAATSAVAIGSSANASKGDSIAIGYKALIDSGMSSIAIGHNSHACDYESVALGAASDASAYNSIALGHAASVIKNSDGAIAIGSNSASRTFRSVALGSRAYASGQYSSTFGSDSYVAPQTYQSVAVGYSSVASDSNVVSFGHKASDIQSTWGDPDDETYGPNHIFQSQYTRRLVNVSDGIDPTDVSTVGQLTTETTARSDADIVLSNRIGSLSADGNYIRSSATNDVVTNLLALDTQLKATDIVAIKYDGDDHALATLGGTNGTKLTNLKQGTLSASSTDAVTGAQLHAVKQDITGFAENIQKNSDNIRSLNSSVTSALSSVAVSGLLVDTMDANKADASLNNLTDSGKQILKQYAENAVQEYMAAQQGTNSTSSMAPMMYAGNSNTLSVTDAGNGSLHVGEGSYVNGTSSIAIGVGNQVNANNSGAFGDPSIINADASYVLGNDDTINIGATGSFIVGNNGVSDAKGGLLFGSNTKATASAEDGIALGNRTEVSAKNAIALGSDSIADTENTLSIGNSNLKRKIVNVADGDVSQNSNEAVTGAQLFLTNEKVQQNTDAIAKKADIDASNINTSDWATKLGIGKVEDGNADLVTGGTVYDAIQGIKGNDLVQSNGDAITIGANSTASVIDVSNANGQGRAITGIVTDVNDASSAANVGYVNAITDNIVKSTNSAIQRVDNKVNKVGANAAAIANLPTPTFDGEEKWAFAAGVGHYQGETAGAVGAFYKPTDNVIARVSGSFGNGDEMIGAGVAVSLNKGNTPAVSKAQLVRTINAQAGQIQQQANEIQSMKVVHQSEMDNIRADYEGKIAAQNEEIAQLKVMMADLAAKVK